MGWPTPSPPPLNDVNSMSDAIIESWNFLGKKSGAVMAVPAAPFLCHWSIGVGLGLGLGLGVGLGLGLGLD